MATYVKICKHCKKQFNTNGSKTIYCPECSKIEVECFICGKKFITSRLIYERTLNEKRKFLCSKKCSSTYAGKFSCKNLYDAYCEKCGEITKHNPDGSCKKCISLQNLQSESMQKWIISEEANKIRRKNGQKWNNSEEGKKFHSKLISNFNKSKEGQENIKRNLDKIHNLMSQGFGANSEENLRKRINDQNGAFGKGIHFNYCEKCNQKTYHIGLTCLKCNPNILNNKIPLFKIINNILYYYDYSIKDYIPWQEYKEKFKTKIELNNSFIDEIKLMYPNAFIQTTFRTQESDDWTGARQAFEQDLVDMNINWFVYIKFYFNKENKIKPLVVGKSGSLNVNSNGSDVNFSTNINDGPARRFINETDAAWDKTQILIIPCCNVQEAYNIENIIAKKFNLFQS